MTQDIHEKSEALEKQRLNLEAMSQELTNKLHLMISQQEKRVQQFISVETNETPPLPTPTPVASPAPVPQSKVAFTLTSAPTPPPPVHHKAQALPQAQPSYVQQRLEEFYADKEDEVEETKEENAIGLARVIAFIILFLVISRACSG